MMRNILLIVALTISLSAFGRDLIYEELLLNGGLTSIEKAEIEKKYGAGRIEYPEYECGFHANDQSGAPYYQLIYDNLTFIGSDKETFVLEIFDFSDKNTNSLSYKGIELSSHTTKEKFVEVFGGYAKEYFGKNPSSDRVLLFFTKSDDGVMFKFRDNKLVQYVYWSPC